MFNCFQIMSPASFANSFFQPVIGCINIFEFVNVPQLQVGYKFPYICSFIE